MSRAPASVASSASSDSRLVPSDTRPLPSDTRPVRSDSRPAPSDTRPLPSASVSSRLIQRLRMCTCRAPPRAASGCLQRLGLTVVLLIVVSVHYVSTHLSQDPPRHAQDGYGYQQAGYPPPAPQQAPAYPNPPGAPPPLETGHAFYGIKEEQDGLHFVSSHNTRIAPHHSDNWVDSVNRPYFPASHDRLFSFGMDEQRIEQMDTKLPTLLENYKNPCWYEEVPRDFTYNSSFFYNYYRAGMGLLPHGDWQSTFRNMENRIQFRKRQSRDGRGWRLRCYPYYFVLGFTKAGTTDYCRILHLFPNVFSGIKKEPQYWNKIRSVPTQFPGERRSVRPTLADYLDLYDAAAEGIRHQSEVSHGESYHSGIVGDCDPQTVWQLFGWDKMAGNDDSEQPNYKTPHHLHSLYPRTKFIVLLRDPVERAFSHFRFFQGQKKNAESDLADFHDNVKKTVTLMEECTRHKTTRQCIHDRTLVPKSVHTAVTVGLYSAHIREWFKVFPREQFLFIKSEDYFERRANAIRETIEFLGVEIGDKDLHNLEEVGVVNAGNTAGRTRMRHDTERLLKNFYRPYNQDLMNFLQDKTFQWGY